jgi:hypothetical protein
MPIFDPSDNKTWKWMFFVVSGVKTVNGCTYQDSISAEVKDLKI